MGDGKRHNAAVGRIGKQGLGKKRTDADRKQGRTEGELVPAVEPHVHPEVVEPFNLVDRHPGEFVRHQE
jgi:hypothetical protein